MKKLVTLIVAVAFVFPYPASADNFRSVSDAGMINVYSAASNSIHVYAGINSDTGNVEVFAENAAGPEWQAEIAAEADHRYPINISISDQFVLVSGTSRRNLGFAALISSGELVWHKEFQQISDSAVYPSGESVVSGYDTASGNARIDFVSNSGVLIDSHVFDFGYLSDFEEIILRGDEIVARLESRCGETGDCAVLDEKISILTINSDGVVLSNNSQRLGDFFQLGDGFYLTYPDLTVASFALGASGGYVVSAIGRKNDTGQNCLLVAHADNTLGIFWNSGPVFCNDGEDIYENRGALAVSDKGEVVVSVGSYYGTALAADSSGATDFVNVVFSNSGSVVFSEQFGGDKTDHPHSVSIFNNAIVMAGNRGESGVISKTLYTLTANVQNNLVSPGWNTPIVEQEVTVATEPLNLSLSRSVNSIRASWSDPVSDGGYKIDDYYAIAYDANGEVVGQCHSAPIVNSCSIEYNLNGVYTVSVSAVNRNGAGASATASIELFYGTPSAPEVVRYYTSRGRIVFFYSRPDDGGSRVSRYYAEVIRDGEVIKSVRNSRNKTAFAISRLQPGEYSFRVSALNARGLGDWSEEITVVVP